MHFYICVCKAIQKMRNCFHLIKKILTEKKEKKKKKTNLLRLDTQWTTEPNSNPGRPTRCYKACLIWSDWASAQTLSILALDVGRKHDSGETAVAEGASQVVLVVKNLPATSGNVRDGFDPWVRKMPWRRAWQPTPVFLPGESHGKRSLAGYSPWDRKESDMTEEI